jgi:hypothetical protein
MLWIRNSKSYEKYWNYIYNTFRLHDFYSLLISKIIITLFLLTYVTLWPNKHLDPSKTSDGLQNS